MIVPMPPPPSQSIRISCPFNPNALTSQVHIDTSKFKDVTDDLAFTKMLLQEKSVAVLPGDIFRAPNFVRIVFCAPPAMLTEACRRIADFCQEHAK
jgi:tyrosine aminotransferase